MEPYQELESKWAEFCGMEHCVACSSGTAALHLALEALQLPLGSRIIVPEFTMIACARAVTLAGMIPLFVDCGNNLLSDVESQGWVTSDVYSAYMAVHVYGRREDMDWIASSAGVCHPVIEDLAEAHGVKPHPQTDVACYSFYKNKIIAGEEGGMVAFRDPAHAALARQLRSLGFTDAHDFLHVPRGHNYRMSNAHAKLVLASLSWYEENAADRRDIEGWFNELVPTAWHMPPRDAVWVYDLRIPGMTGEQQDTIVRALNGCGITARHGFRPMSEQPEYLSEYRHLNAYRLSREILYFNVSPGMTRDYVAKAVKTLLQAASAVGIAVEAVENPPAVRP